ncbi:MAG: hypothetical protein KF869_12505 [Phycisphaeraceae bacterium]|nr:hypothetical protein [Phycisphaeraceae bacterium]
MARHALGFDIGSNSVGSAWIDRQTGEVDIGLSIFPAGVDETDETRGEPKNVKRRMTRRTRITLARRSARKRELRLELIAHGLLPSDAATFQTLLQTTDPWTLRRKGLDHALTPHEFGRVLLHLAQRRGALGLREPPEEDEAAQESAAAKDDGKVKAAIGAARAAMLEAKARSFGEFMCLLRDERRTPISSEDRRPVGQRAGVREWRSPIRNRAGKYEFAADRPMIRDEFARLWDAQRRLGGPLAKLLTDALRLRLDDESGDSMWRHRGLMFGQRRVSWDMGTLGRCVLEPTERCVPLADRYGSYFRVIETVNNIRVIEHGQTGRPLTPEERNRVIALLRGPLGVHETGAHKGKPKRSASVADIRLALGLGRASKTSPVRLNIEADRDREINTDWFHREIVHGALSEAGWAGMTERQRESVNRALLNFNPEDDRHAERLRAGAAAWWTCSTAQADALVAAWRKRPPLEKRLNLSRRAVLNMLRVMDAPIDSPAYGFNRTRRWPTQIEARKLISEDADFLDATTGQPLHPRTRDRYATGAKGLTARDRYYMKMHPDTLPPAPMLTNPVVRKAIHEVRRHLIAHIRKHGRKPDQIVVELARDAKMSGKEADLALLRSRLRDRIRKDIIETFNLHALKASQQRIAVDRVVLAVQQNNVCPLCGQGGLTARVAAYGEGCELAHITPRGIGGGAGHRNMVLAHTKCNRDMGRRTPRQWWGDHFDAEMNRIELMYREIERLSLKQVEKAAQEKLWACYFDHRDDDAKIANFKRTVEDIQGFSDRDLTDTRYATRQVLAYLSDALFDGKGLPERGGERRIFTTDGRWTSDLRREWGLFQDAHDAKAKGLSAPDEHARREKNRGDHRHHALDAVAIALTDRSVQIQWENRVKAADKAGIAAEEFEAFCRDNPIPPPAPFKDRDDLRDRALAAIFGDRPVAHRPVKRKLIGAMHEETLLGPVLNADGKLTDLFTGKKSVLALNPNHLRLPRPETPAEAVERLAARRQRETGTDERAARKWAKGIVSGKGYQAAIVDPPPGKSGLVRDLALRMALRERLESNGLDPDNFTANQIKKLAEAGQIAHKSGVPIRSFVLLRTMNDPVIISRWEYDYATGKPRPAYSAQTDQGNAAAARAYVGGNNHHIEIRVDVKDKWSGEIVSAYEAAQRKLAFFRALRTAGVPRFKDLKLLPKAERRKWTPQIAAADAAHPLVDRADNPDKGGRFVLSLCEGEMVFMRHKDRPADPPSYFVVAKLDKPQAVVLVPHWDARKAGERKDSSGKVVTDSAREQFAATPNDFKTLAPPGHPHALKVRVSPLGEVEFLERD